jgi:hypothetical protein
VMQVSFWRGMSAINILTDMALIFFPIHVIVTLQMSMSKKLTILTFFGARSLYTVYPNFARTKGLHIAEIS